MAQNKLFNERHNASISLKKCTKKLFHRRDSLVYYTSLSEYIYIIQYIRPSTSYIHTKWMNETLMFMSWSMAKKASQNQDNVFLVRQHIMQYIWNGAKKHFKSHFNFLTSFELKVTQINYVSRNQLHNTANDCQILSFCCQDLNLKGKTLLVDVNKLFVFSST